MPQKLLPELVVTKATVRAAGMLGLSNASLALITGLDEATISLMISGAQPLVFESEGYERSLLLIRLYQGLHAMVGGDENSMQQWMMSNNDILQGIPSEKIETVQGLLETLDYVEAPWNTLGEAIHPECSSPKATHLFTRG